MKNIRVFLLCVILLFSLVLAGCKKNNGTDTIASDVDGNSTYDDAYPDGTNEVVLGNSINDSKEDEKDKKSYEFTKEELEKILNFTFDDMIGEYGTYYNVNTFQGSSLISFDNVPFSIRFSVPEPEDDDIVDALHIDEGVKIFGATVGMQNSEIIDVLGEPQDSGMLMEERYYLEYNIGDMGIMFFSADANSPTYLAWVFYNNIDAEKFLEYTFADVVNAFGDNYKVVSTEDGMGISYDELPIIFGFSNQNPKDDDVVNGLWINEGGKIYGIRIGMYYSDIRYSLGEPISESISPDGKYYKTYAMGDVIIEFVTQDDDTKTDYAIIRRVE